MFILPNIYFAELYSTASTLFLPNLLQFMTAVSVMTSFFNLSSTGDLLIKPGLQGREEATIGIKM